MINLNKLSKRIKKNEGYKNQIYLDQLGHKTIGFGHLIKKNDKFIVGRKYKKKILNEIFIKDFKKAIFFFDQEFGSKKIPTNVKEVIIEMIFQLGIRGTKKFKKFFYHIHKSEYFMAAFEMLNSKWYDQTPSRVLGLKNILLKNTND